MNNQVRTNAELIEEISILTHTIMELENSEAERKRAVEALQGRQEIFRQFMENSPIHAF
jgi:PAS domain-containing protein